MRFEIKPIPNLVRKSVVALAIKALSAPLALVMMVTVSHSLSLAAFGVFSFAFALVTFLAKVATAGQPQLLLRELASGDIGHEAHRTGVTLFGYRMTLGAGLAIALALVLAGIVLNEPTLITAAALVPLLAVSEVQTSILRANGSVINAMALREIVWRVMVIAVVFGLQQIDGQQDAHVVMALISLLLLVAVLLQAWSHPATHFVTLAGKPRTYDTERWLLSARHFWATSIISAATPQLSTVIVGLFSPITAVGPFFAALKAAQLLNIVQVATNVIAAPLLARHYANGQIAALQKVCSYTALASAGSALLGLLVFAIFGRQLLHLFGTGFEQAYPHLLIMSIGYALTAAFGQNGQLLQMAGQEKKFMKIMAVSNVFGLTLSLVLSFFFGTIGGAIALSATFAVWNTWAWYIALRTCGVDTSVFGAARLLRISR